MKFPRFLLLCLALLSSLWLGTAHALPTVSEVQSAVQRGDYPAAEKMMREVVAAKPDSARGHYVLAEILAHQRQFKEAVEQVGRAKALDPAIKFTDPTKFAAFEHQLQREQAAEAKPPVPAAVNVPPPVRAVPVEQSRGGGVPVWLLVAGAIVFIWLAAGWMRRRNAAQTMSSQPAMAGGYGAGGPGYGPAGYGPGYGAAPPSSGSGLMGVGLAAAGGVAAGMLAEKLLHEGRDERSLPRDSGGGSGLAPGSFNDGSAANDLVSRDIDFGSGGNDWGGDAGGDMGGGGSDDW